MKAPIHAFDLILDEDYYQNIRLAQFIFDRNTPYCDVHERRIKHKIKKLHERNINIKI